MFGKSTPAEPALPLELTPEGGKNTPGHKEQKAKAYYNSQKPSGPKMSASLKGLKAAAK